MLSEDKTESHWVDTPLWKRPWMNEDHVTTYPFALAQAVADIWRIRPPGPANLYSAPEFVRLRETCEKYYDLGNQRTGLTFALGDALRACGLPSRLPLIDSHIALSPGLVTARLDESLRATHRKRTHLCPLNLGGDLPTLQFGNNHIRNFSPEELNVIVDSERLNRINTNWTFDAERFSQFTWLVVEEDVQLDRSAGARKFHNVFEHLNEDSGRIDPHSQRLPTAVEDALMMVLIAPWEDWMRWANMDWRPFHIPWVYTLNDDIFARPSPPPSPDTLSWGPYHYRDNDGEVEAEIEQPVALPLNDMAVDASNWINDETWASLCRIRQTPVFNRTPISHFFVRAFLTEGIDEFLAHITAIEAALGLESDYPRPGVKSPKGTRQGSSTVKTRIAGLLDGQKDRCEFGRLFDRRSEYLHGRKMTGPISGSERLSARVLARRVVCARIDASLQGPDVTSREDFLGTLSVKGANPSPHPLPQGEAE